MPGMNELSASDLKSVLLAKLKESLTEPIPEGTPRRLHGAASLPGKVSSVVGVRRSGKTTFVHQERREQLAAGAAREHVPYVNFEDERLSEMTAAQLGLLLEEYGRLFPEARERARVLWSFDEIQLVKGWERFVRRLLDEGRNDILVTGSSAALLSREIATALRGRAWEVPIYPFSFAEALLFQGRPIPARPGFLGGAERGRIERAFLDWLSTGGFPEVQKLDAASREKMLSDYVDVAMLRDVMERHGVGNVVGLRWMVRQLLGNAGALFSVEKFHAALKSQGVAIARDTVHQLLAWLEDCFLVRPVWMESASERQRMVNPRKCYPVDTALIALFDRTGRANTGHALETAVLVELQRRQLAVTYVKTPEGHEVDFLARGAGGQADLIQVCADATDPATAERELRALVEAGRIHPKAKKRLLTLTSDGRPAEVPRGVEVQPAYEWMLSAPD